MAYDIKGDLTVARNATVGKKLTVDSVNIKTFATVTAAEAITGSTSSSICYITELSGWFQYSATSGATVDHVAVLSTGDGGQSRWLLTTADADVVVPDVTYTNSNPSVITVGGISSGTTFSSKTMTEMWNSLLYPTQYPALEAPALVSFTLTQAGFQEVGASLTLNFSATFSRGTITPAYGTSGLRSGLPNQYTYTGTGLSNQASTSLTDSQTVTPYVVVLGAQNWTGAVAYDIGEQPLDSVGGNYSTPLAAGSTGATTRTITGVYPTFATTSAIATLTKQALAAHGSQKDASMVAESGSDKQTIEFPTGWGTITILQQYNTLSGTYDTISLSTFTSSSVTETIQGNVVNYTRYTHNGPTTGARILRWRVS